MTRATSNRRIRKTTPSFGQSISTEQLQGLAAELQKLRAFPPITKRSDGKYEGDILGFVKGLRLSARVVYYLRECLSHTRFEVSWGHLLDGNQESCSPECDIVIHNKGHVRKWNGNDNPIMEFKFIAAEEAHIVVSCKSLLRSIDAQYPKDLNKYGVAKLVLFAECCDIKKYQKLRENAIKRGYTDVFVLYFTNKEMQVIIDDAMHIAFGKCIRDLLPI